MAEINTKIIDNYIEKNHLTKKEFCKVCEISTSTLNKIYKNGTNIKITTYIKLVKALKVKSKDLLGV